MTEIAPFTFPATGHAVRTPPGEAWLTEDRWWDAAAVALVIGKTERWLVEQCAPEDSTFPHHRVGRDLRFSLADRRAIDAMTARGRGPLAQEQAAHDVALDVALAGMARRKRTPTAAVAAH